MLELRAVSKRYGGVVATDDVTLDVVRGEARAIAADIGLAAREAAVAATLAHGEQRALEVGLALATRPQLVLLDEPMAGMGPQESRAMLALIQRIRSRVTVLLVEHDMDAV